MPINLDLNWQLSEPLVWTKKSLKRELLFLHFPLYFARFQILIVLRLLIVFEGINRGKLVCKNREGHPVLWRSQRLIKGSEFQSLSLGDVTRSSSLLHPVAVSAKQKLDWSYSHSNGFTASFVVSCKFDYLMGLQSESNFRQCQELKW